MKSILDDGNHKAFVDLLTAIGRCKSTAIGDQVSPRDMSNSVETIEESFRLRLGEKAPLRERFRFAEAIFRPVAQMPRARPVKLRISLGRMLLVSASGLQRLVEPLA